MNKLAMQQSCRVTKRISRDMNFRSQLRQRRETAAASLHASSQELIKAYNRIGKDSEAAMRWLMRLTRIDLATVSAGDSSNTFWEVLWFTVYGFPGPSGANPFSKALHGAAVTKPHSLLTTKDISWIQALVKKKIADVLDSGYTKFPSIVISPDVRIDRNLGHGFLSADTSRVRSSFIFSLAQLLALHGSLLQRCAECQSVFTADRRNKIYCVKACQNRSTMRTYRRAHPTSGKLGRPRIKSRR